MRHPLRNSLLAGTAGSIVLLGTLPIDPSLVLRGYLVAVTGWGAVSIGSVMLLAVDHLVPEGWRLRVDVTLEAAALSLPLVGALFVPILLCLSQIYPWAEPNHWQRDWPRREYLSQGFFIVRTAAYFLLWTLLAWGLSGRPGRKRPGLAAFGLIALTLTGSLAGIDWLMTAQPAFRSSIWGMLFVWDQMLSAFALAVMAALTVPFAPLREARTRFLANVLLTGVMTWAYLSFMQYLIIWSGDLPHEVEWYLRRSENGWGWVTWAVVLLLGALPFLILVPDRLRAKGVVVAGVAALAFVMRLVENAWLALPAFDDAAARALPATLVANIAVGGLWSASFFWLLQRRKRLATQGGGDG